jgi:hypothetical protein
MRRRWRALELASTPKCGRCCAGRLAAFAGRAAGDVVVACTQDAALRQRRGGGRQDADDPVRQHPRNQRLVGRGQGRNPKIAALLSLAGLPEPAPVPRVDYRSEGRLLIVGPAEASLHWAKSLSGHLGVTVLVTGRASGAELPAQRDFPVYSGRVGSISGWIGAFDVAWSQENPIDLDLCTLQCVRGRVENAIDFAYRSTSNAARRIAGASPPAARRPRSISRGRSRPQQRFDLVLDLQRTRPRHASRRRVISRLAPTRSRKPGRRWKSRR